MNKKILALDFGTKICGFAITDDSNILSLIHSSFEVKNYDFQSVVIYIKKIMKLNNNEIDTIVIGMAKNMDQSDSKTSIAIEKFAFLLNRLIPELKVVFYNEQITTRIAVNQLKSLDITAKQIKAKKDALAAQIILSDYLKSQIYNDK